MSIVRQVSVWPVFLHVNADVCLADVSMVHSLLPFPWCKHNHSVGFVHMWQSRARTAFLCVFTVQGVYSGICNFWGTLFIFISVFRFRFTFHSNSYHFHFMKEKNHSKTKWFTKSPIANVVKKKSGHWCCYFIVHTRIPLWDFYVLIYSITHLDLTANSSRKCS